MGKKLKNNILCHMTTIIDSGLDDLLLAAEAGEAKIASEDILLTLRPPSLTGQPGLQSLGAIEIKIDDS